MNNLEKVDIYQAIIIDLLQESDYIDIRVDVGLPIERCKEIEKIYHEIKKEYKQRHNLGE